MFEGQRVRDILSLLYVVATPSTEAYIGQSSDGFLITRLRAQRWS